MKKPFLLVTALLLGVLAASCVSHDKSRAKESESARPLDPNPAETRARKRPRAPERPVGLRPEKVRAVWVDAWGPGFESARQCDRLVEHCVEHNINTILVQVRRTGDAFYDSDLEPRGRVDGQGDASDFDPLRYLVERARDEEGIRLEAWIVANRLWQSDAPPPAGKPTHLLEAHPDWLMINREGKTTANDDKKASYLDPALPAVRAHLARVAADIARRYRVDAIHLDYIRYPDKDWGYGPASLERFRKDARRSDFPAVGDTGFIDWRVKQVELTLREIRRAVKLASPDCELTAATILWGDPPQGDFEKSAAYRAAFQDWPSWCRDGLLEVVYPMHYRRQDDDAQRQAFGAWLAYLDQLSLGSARLVVGLGAYLNTRQGTATQISLVNQGRSFDGYALFSYRSAER